MPYPAGFLSFWRVFPVFSEDDTHRRRLAARVGAGGQRRDSAGSAPVRFRQDEVIMAMAQSLFLSAQGMCLGPQRLHVFHE
ncbi:hypothetical protein KESI111651_10575 [Kerstersia similis]